MKCTMRWRSASLLIGLVVACQPPGPSETEVTLETENDKALYALGFATGLSMQRYLEEEDLGPVELGLHDAISGRDAQVEDFQARFLRFQAERAEKVQAERAEQGAPGEKEASQAFLEQEAAKEGATRTESGLIYIAQEAGSGESPTAEDTVVVHYHGTLRDGTVFDSSVQRNQPFRTRLNRVIPCWTEGLQKMKVGGKARLVCPSDIAYGNRGQGRNIKPGAALAFDVELIEIAGKP